MKKSNWFSRFAGSRTYIFLLGLSATLWFLLRVIPKPSRARYPCMQAASPFMASFVIYLLGLSAGWFSFRKFRKSLKQAKYAPAVFFLSAAFISFILIWAQQNKTSFASAFSQNDDTFPVLSNTPIGLAKGLHPGRVVWVHDPFATNEYYVPTYNSTDYWYSDSNTDEEIISLMLAKAIRQYAGNPDLSAAWDDIFRYFNSSHGRGDKGYTPGEKIAFKINLTNQSAPSKERPQRMDATPQLLNAVLDQLVNVVGVAQKDIILGDPYREFRLEYRNLVKTKFPDVKYVDGKGANGILKTVPTSTEVLVFSDKKYKSTLPSQYISATYVINIPCLKTHNEGGITLIGKNHQGSYLKKGDDPASQSAYLMHYSLQSNLPGTGKYRHTVDYMGHKDTGGKALIYIIDGIWAGESWEGWIKKFKSAPFNDDYPNSIFVGQDPVALESVCYDVLFEEYLQDVDKQNYPITYKEEIADYLKQCASSEFWPAGISYDPEGDGTPIGSLGVFEHWNNATDRQYSRNLGTGNGIELLYFSSGQVKTPEVRSTDSHYAYPNPFYDNVQFYLPFNPNTGGRLEIFDSAGKLVQSLRFSGMDKIEWDGTDRSKNQLPAGIYLYSIKMNGLKNGLSGKVILAR